MSGPEPAHTLGGAERRRVPEWIRSAWTRLRRFTTGGSYIKFQTVDDDQTPVDAYGKNY